MNKQEVAKALKNARNNAGLTCREVAEFLDKSEKTVSAWEHCNGQPDIETLFRLCKIYNLSGIDEILGHIPAENFGVLRVEEKDLISLYRQLTTNSKQIVTTVARLELNHVHSVKQGETPIRILQKTKRQMETAMESTLNRKPAPEKERLLKVFSQSAAAGFGNFVNDDSFEMVAIPSIPYGTEFGIRISGDSMQPQINDGDIVFVKRQPSLNSGDIGIFIYDGDAYCKQMIYRDNTYYLHSLNGKYKDIPILSDTIYTVGIVLDNYNGNS